MLRRWEHAARIHDLTGVQGGGFLPPAPVCLFFEANKWGLKQRCCACYICVVFFAVQWGLRNNRR